MLSVLLLQMAMASASVESQEPVDTLVLSPIVVQARDLTPEASEAVARIDAEQLALIRASHPSEVFSRIPGAWITRGSGQEHLSAIRSPLLTGAGGCGGLLYLEEGVPIRPPGFCNINNLFEVNLLQADSISVLRGPGGIGHASGGLHGVIDVRTRAPNLALINNLAQPRGQLRFESGSDDYYRLESSTTMDLDQAGVLALDANFTDAGSFREDEGYQHGFLTAHHQAMVGQARLSTIFSAAQLDQDTAGFITGENAFEDPDRRDDNNNPEAFRNGSALRLIHRVEWSDHRLTFFARRSRMTFLQHFLPGKPLERNGQVSGGLQFDSRVDLGGVELDWGLDAELFDGFLYQRQDQPASGPPARADIRPVGQHYDYDVFGQRVGGFVAGQWNFNNDWSLRAGLHADWIRYDYQTNLMPGNLTDQGEACDFGGCLYNRPADRDDSFTNLAPELTLSKNMDKGSLWLRLARGFRAPQATELYRLQRGQNVADLDSETLDAIELGVRNATVIADRPLNWELVGFAQDKRNFIFRDGEGFNVSDGKTEHVGLEFALDYALSPNWIVAARGTLVRHRYRFDRNLGGETIVSGNDVDSAPRRLASADISWLPGSGRWLGWQAQLALEHTGRYFLNAANSQRYSGHTLWHGFIGYRWDTANNGGWNVDLKLRNLTGKRYAERADFAFGNFRYFPGAGRQAFVSVGYDW